MNKLFVRVGDRELSLWQSVVAAHVKDNHFAKAAPMESMLAVLNHDMVQATNVFVHNRFNKLPEKLSLPAAKNNATAIDVKAHMSELAFDIAKAKFEHQLKVEDALTKEFRKYSDADTSGFLGCVTAWIAAIAKYSAKFKYNDWTKEGKGDINYGVINYKLPNDAKVGIIGDWGTGLPDAIALLTDMVVNKNVDVIIHLGDIYYSATPPDSGVGRGEVYDNFAGPVEMVRQLIWKEKQVPVFSIPGNHDYYSGGYGYYDMIREINWATTGAMQNASYFCLRTEDNGWQFLGMDTGFYDSNPLNAADNLNWGPPLQSNELLWHLHKLDTFKGGTILLSHHQLYSANAEINGRDSGFKKMRNLNFFLLDSFKSFFKSNIAGWLWGHEHNMVLYADKQFGLEKGRLIGASAYEEETSANPYAIKYDNIKYLDPSKYQIKRNGDFYNHSYAVIDLSKRKNPTDAVEVSYYEFPSWGATAPLNPTGTLVDNYTEKFSKPSAGRDMVFSGDKMYIKLFVPGMGGPITSGGETKYVGGQTFWTFLGPHFSGVYNYPELNMDNGVQFIIDDMSNSHDEINKRPVHSESTVFIKTCEPLTDAYLGAFDDKHNLYYYNNMYDKTKSSWKMIKETSNVEDNRLYYGDIVSFKSIHYDQWMTIDGIYLTTTANEELKGYFIILKDDHSE